MSLILKSLVILFACFVWETWSTYLTYATGLVQPAIYPSKLCVNSGGQSPRIEQIDFQGLFATKPSFLAYLQKFDLQYNSQLEFLYNVSSLSETKAEITITCTSTNKNIYALGFYWLAFIDPRITLIDSGKIDVTGISSQTYQYFHNNVHANKGFINMQTFGYKGSQDYSLQITSVTSSQVSVQFTSNTNNLLSIMFQIVIGPDDAFTIVKKETGYIYQRNEQHNLNKVENHVLMVPQYGYQWTTRTGYGYVLQTTLLALSDTTWQYEFYEWGSSGIDKIRYQEVQFNLKNYNVYYPFICSKMRVVKKQVLSVQPLKLYINEQSKTYLFGDLYIWQLDPGVQTLNIIASLKCPIRYKLVGYVLKCIDCIKDTYDLSTDCYGGAIDYVEHRIRLKQQDYVYQQLSIEVTDTSITITQLTLHPKSIILSLELIRK